MILRRKFCVYLHFMPLFTSWCKHELRKRQRKFLLKTNTLQVKTLSYRFSVRSFYDFSLFLFFSHAIVQKFLNILVHDSYMVSSHF